MKLEATEGYKFTKAKVTVRSFTCGGKNWVFDFDGVGTFCDALLLAEKKLTELYLRPMRLMVKDIDVVLS